MYLSLTLLTALRRNQDHTVSTLHTIDSRCRSILQHRNVLHRAQVHRVHRSLDTIYKDQRVSTAVQRSRTANHNLRVFLTGQTGTCRRDHTRQVTSQGCTKRGQSAVTLQRLCVRLGDTSHHGCLLLLSVTDNHHFTQLGGIFLQDDLDRFTAHRFHLLGNHSHIGDDNHTVLFWHRQTEHTVKVGDRSAAALAFQNHRGADNGFPALVDDSSCHVDSLLSPCTKAERQQHQQCRDCSLHQLLLFHLR